MTAGNATSLPADTSIERDEASHAGPLTHPWRNWPPTYTPTGTSATLHWPVASTLNVCFFLFGVIFSPTMGDATHSKAHDVHHSASRKSSQDPRIQYTHDGFDAPFTSYAKRV